MKKIISIVTVVVLIGAIGWTLAGNKQEIDSRKEVKTTTQEIAVTAVRATSKTMDNQLYLVGTAEAFREVTVAAETSGRITQINFKLGDFVNKGDVLALVDDTYKRLALENAQLNYDKYKEDYARYQNLRKGDAVSETQLRDMKLAFDNASIQLENAQKQYSDTRVLAPFSGYITSKNAELGAYVNVGTLIAGIADIGQLKIKLDVSEKNVYALQTGQKVAVNATVYPDAVYNGAISNISPKGSSAHTYPVEIILSNNKTYPLKAGTYVNVMIEMGDIQPTLMIPRDAIVSSVKEPSVYMVNGDVANLIKITTGRNFNDHIEVLAGLNENDLVVTNGQINLMDGAKVQIIN
jgi:RND family efflux transporter MFP subunit